MVDTELNCKVPENRVTFTPESFVGHVRELNDLHLEIVRDEGQVIARLDEIENFVEVRMNQIRGLRSAIKEKQKTMRQKMAAITQVVG